MKQQQDNWYDHIERKTDFNCYSVTETTDAWKRMKEVLHPEDTKWLEKTI